jgi:hypothetical protein
MALIGSAPALRCPCDGTLLVGKDVQPLCQTYSNSRVHGIGRVTVVVTKTSVWVGKFSGVSCFPGEVCGCVPGLLRTGSPVVPQWFS